MSDSPYAFDAPDADVILRAPLQPGSEEFKAFHAHKAVLSVASTLFRGMFSIPQPPQPAEGDTTLPVIPVVEPAGVFETFLRLIYPIEPPVIDSLQLVDDLFRLAEKYMASGVHSRLKKLLLSPSFLKDDPILVYAVACRMNLDEEAKKAIPHTFRIDLVRDIPRNELRMMTVEAYHRLLMEHSLRRDQLIDIVDEVSRSRGLRINGKCHCVVKLRREMRLKFSRSPSLDRETLDMCLSSAQEQYASECTGCLLRPRDSPGFLLEVMRRV